MCLSECIPLLSESQVFKNYFYYRIEKWIICELNSCPVSLRHTSLSPHSLILECIAFITTMWVPLTVHAQSNNSFNGLLLLHKTNSKCHQVCSYEVCWTFCLLVFACLVGKLHFIHLSFRLEKSSHSYQFQTGTRKLFLMEYSGTLFHCTLMPPSSWWCSTSSLFSSF